MLPFGHAAFGYLCYSLYTRRYLSHPPIGLAVFALGLGTQFPDLIDKPLTWTVPLLPYGRSLGHSLFTLAALYTLLRIWSTYPDHRVLVNAFAIGYGTHLFGDGIGPVISGDYLTLGFLFWPITPVPVSSVGSFSEFFLSLTLTPLLAAEAILTVCGLAVWFHDGLPGVKDLFGQLRPPRDSNNR
jgi:hypothetical protein